MKFCVCKSLCSFNSFNHCITYGTVSESKYSISINKSWKYQYCTRDFSHTLSGKFLKGNFSHHKYNWDLEKKTWLEH